MKFDETFILSYIKKELPDDVAKECDALLQSSNEFREEVRRIRYVYDLSENLKRQKEIDTPSAWKKLGNKVSTLSMRQKIWSISRTAAAILLPLFLLYQYGILPALKPSVQETITLCSAPGIISKITLPDGSEVWLNAQSKLTYPPQFSEKERTVQLSGEAYFKVKADKKNRFSVITPDNFTVSAFGTEFNVNAYPDDSNSQITLVKGNIDVAPDRSSKKETLVAGQKIGIDRGTKKTRVVQADTYVETAWKDGKMVFRRETLEVIAQKLSRKFRATIRFEGDELKNYEYTATFTEETLEDILDLLKRSAPITYSITKQKQLTNNSFDQQTIIIKHKKI